MKKNKQAIKELLKDAGDLADFANAELPGLPNPPHVLATDLSVNTSTPWTAPTDKGNYARLFPASFWNEPEIREGAVLWNYKTFQAVLRQAWQEGFPANLVVRLVQMPTGDMNEVADFLKGTTWPYQRAVMLLFVESWRIRFCQNCGARFVKDKPHQKNCSLDCFNKYRTTYKTTKARQYRAKEDK